MQGKKKGLEVLHIQLMCCFSNKLVIRAHKTWMDPRIIQFNAPLFARSENNVKLSLNCLGVPSMAGDKSDKLQGYTFLEVSNFLGIHATVFK